MLIDCRLFLFVWFQVQRRLIAFEIETFVKPPAREVNTELIKAINITIEEIFLKKFTTVSLVSAVKDPMEPFFQDFRSAVLEENKGVCLYRLDNYTKIQTIRNRLKNSNIILLDSFKSFEIFNTNLQSDMFNFRGFFLLVFIYGNFKESNLIFDALWKKNILNVNALYEEVDEYNEATVKLVTFFPFTPTTCGNANPVEVDTFNVSAFNIPTDAIFPNKVKNLHMCEVRLVTFHRCPASCVSNHTGKLTVSGYDIGIIDTIASRLNFKLVKNILRGPEQWGNVFPNLSTSGAIAKIMANESDIAIGDYMLRPKRVFLMENSAVYFNVPLVFVIPSGAKLTAFEKLIRPFEAVVWILMLITFSLGLLVIFILNWKHRSLRAFVYGTGIRTPMINMVMAMLGQSSRKLPRRNFARFILMVFLLFCLVQRNVYQGLLYIFLQTDGRNKEIQEIRDLVNNDYDFYMYESYVGLIEDFPRIYNKRKIITTERDFIFNKPLEESVKAAYMTTLNNVVYKNQLTYKNFTMKVCKQTLLMVNIVMYFPKNFYLAQEIDRVLTDLAAAGLLEHWIQKYADPRFLRPNLRRHGPEAMELHQLYGVFNLCLIGLGISLIVFVIELSTATLKRALGLN